MHTRDTSSLLSQVRPKSLIIIPLFPIIIRESCNILIVDIDEQMREEERKKGRKKGAGGKKKKKGKKKREILTRYRYGSILHRNTVYMEHHRTAAIGIQYTTKKKRGKGKYRSIPRTKPSGFT